MNYILHIMYKQTLRSCSCNIQQICDNPTIDLYQLITIITCTIISHSLCGLANTIWLHACVGVLVIGWPYVGICTC